MRFNPSVLAEIILPNGLKYTFNYNTFGEITKITLPTGGYYRYDYDKVVGLDYENSGPNTLYGQANRGVTTRYVCDAGACTSQQEQVWQYLATNNSTYLLTSVTDPLGVKTERYLYKAHNLTYFGFENALAGHAYDERTYNASGQMLRRTLTEWAETPGQLQPPFQFYYAGRDARPSKQVSVILDTGGNALASISTTNYDADLNEVAINRYDHVSVEPTTAQTGDINSFPLGTLLCTEEAMFLVNDTSIAQATRDAYRARHLIALPSYTRVKNGATIFAETQLKYDEPAYPVLVYSVTPPGWSNPPGVRGNATTTRRWLNINGSYIETHAQYDQCGNSRKVWDGNGNVTETFYTDSFSDGQNRNTFAYATSVITPGPALTSSTVFEFNTGKVVTTTDANNKTTSYFYTDDGGTLDSLQRLRKVTLPDGLGETKYEYGDAPGDLYIRTLTKQDATTWLENRTNFDALGRACRSGHYEGSNSWSVNDTEYDSMGRVKRVTNPYFAANLSGATPGNAAWTTTAYDDLSRVLTVTTPDGAHVDTAYSGNQVTVTDQAGKKRSSQTDALGRLVKVTEDPGGLNYDTTYLYDALGNLRKVTQGAQTRWFAYDSLSRLIRSKNPEQNTNGSLPPYTDPVTGGSGWAMAYSYDANSNLTQRIDARGIVTNYLYDQLNRNYAIDYINGSQISYVRRAYDGAVNGKGRLYYDYTSEGSVLVTHMAIDSYDPLGRPLQKRQHFWQASTQWGPGYYAQQTYDLAGNVKTLTYPSGRTVNYSYDQAGRLSSFSGNLGGSPSTYADTIGYNPAGQMIKERFGTNTSLYHNLHYNNRQQLVSIRVGENATYTMDWSRIAIDFFYGTTAVASGNLFANDTDNNGNLRWQTHWVPLEGGGHVIPQHVDYTYDALNRINSFTETQKDSGGQWIQAASQNFSYDRWGNRKITSVTGGVNDYNPTYDTTNYSNRIVGLGYDAAGNITFDPLTGGTMTYDAENRLLTATNGGGGSYTYDGDGKRVKRITGGQETWHIYGIGGELLAEYAATAAPSAPQKEYGYRGGQLLVVWDGSETGDRKLQWLVQDHLGSTRMVVDRSGSLGGIKRDDFAPFGEELYAGIRRNGMGQGQYGYGPPPSNVRQKFGSKERDIETNLDYFGARYYASAQGRFVSPDEAFADQDQSNPQSWNLYSYARNNPLRYIDEDGRRAETPEEKKKREERERESNREKYGLPMTNKELKDAAELAKQFIDQVNQSQANRDIAGNVIVINTYGMSDGGIVLIALEIGNALYGDQLGQLDFAPPSISGGTKRTKHGERRKNQADAGDTHRQVGDVNRTIRDGKHYIDTETGNNIYVRGNKVVITNNQGVVVTQFKNTRADTLDRVNRGKWKPVS
jgi:RHS repeat-associated protein